MVGSISFLNVFQAKTCFAWLVTDTLADRSLGVHNVMLEASVEAVQVHGSSKKAKISYM